jgi:competence protein ComEC
MSWVVTINMMAIKGLLLYLSWIDSFSVMNLSVVLSPFLNVLALMAAMMVMILLPIKSMFPCALLLMIVACFPRSGRILKGEAWVDVLDVGQGLSVVIRTKKHVLVYDTGMKFYRGNDMGNLVLVPYLKAKHVRHLDAVVISHPDLDHRGGLSSLTKEYPSYTLLVDDPTFYQQARTCHDYPDWTWDGVSFQFFPIHAPFKEKNNHSCVLKVTTAGGQFLLTGDIERTAEAYLVKTYGEQLASSVMLVPHHGSKTSSSASFVEQVKPDHAIASYGFDNRYHFPHQPALKTYQAHHIPVHATQTCGMVQVLLSRDTSRVTCSFYHKA